MIKYKDIDLSNLTVIFNKPDFFRTCKTVEDYMKVADESPNEFLEMGQGIVRFNGNKVLMSTQSGINLLKDLKDFDDFFYHNWLIVVYQKSFLIAYVWEIELEENKIKKKCQNCEDRFAPDGYICENECPYNEDGTLKTEVKKQ